ncbi:increased DNA methylation 2-like [Argentina anserina]|uniref:increased DNA methylation 2-like n=1 Tax=Argentina anserina TaxID=57926 RepID=UPI0021765E69|nr:increased DNA methylation 2-like [Potentilla anserina]
MRLPKLFVPFSHTLSSVLPVQNPSILPFIPLWLSDMDDSSQASDSNPATCLGSRNEQSRMINDDQMFLLYFIMGTYFGPDVKGERPHKSVLRRIAEGLPPYTYEQLAGSQINTAEVQYVYYSVLRKADQSAIVESPMLHQFFHGNLLIQGQDEIANYPQFPDLFPPLLHYNSQSKTKFNFFENIVFIRNPEISYIKPEDLERFKRLTGLEGFVLKRDSERLHANSDRSVHEPKSNGESPRIRSSRSSAMTNYVDDPLKYKDHLKRMLVVAPKGGVEYNGMPVMYSYMAPLPTGNGSADTQKVDPATIFLPSPPTEREWSNIVAATIKGFTLTGSAATGQIGPTIGLIDIGESEDSYLFRVSLPGVRRDEREFSCEVENEGQVLIRGVTITGEKTVYRYSQMFEMQTQNLCPTGHFSISFQLPGPVNPQHFSGNFGTDGILEGVVMKQFDEKGCLC